MIIISATISTTSANRDAIIALCREHSARSRAESGCISHHIHADCEDSSRLFFHEEWQDAKAVAAHFAVPESRDFVKQLTSLVGHRPDMQICRAETISPADLARP
ncbi:Quinol monooxygenase YgiN [Parasphingorhabdus marina DSM 22363]|uniref:Quinol monooxygenase YgiN n=1 Tax=Parasphingorhabdus marina DSM 22363 TaxID=1123272 RepID=A0A1N6GXI9_9SPHN|nr:putative quinol monooxygenase [Parasphingorhabdus marina]SIO12249.1 Quinol monooxygenase YgiN [Parasphingorhabdus marina DSM 22363]